MDFTTLVAHTAGGIFQPGKAYIFVGHNDKFVSRIDHVPINNMEAVKERIDVNTRLRASVLWNGKVLFRADDGKHMYLSRIDRGGVQHIEPAKSVLDVHCEFTVETESNGPWNGAHHVYLKADNGKYVGIANRNGRNNMEASFSGRNNETRFTVLQGV